MIAGSTNIKIFQSIGIHIRYGYARSIFAMHVRKEWLNFEINKFILLVCVVNSKLTGNFCKEQRNSCCFFFGFTPRRGGRIPENNFLVCFYIF